MGRDLARSLCALSTEINRQVGLLIHRSGKIEKVIVGDHDRIVIPPLSMIRTAGGRLRGLRCIHTCFGKSGLNDEDIMDLACLRLDLLSVLTMQEGLPHLLHSAYLVPEPVDGTVWSTLDPVHPAQQSVSFRDFVESLENQFVRARPIREVDKQQDQAILISVTTGAKSLAHESLEELAELGLLGR